jgi:hypothetical protein
MQGAACPPSGGKRPSRAFQLGKLASAASAATALPEFLPLAFGHSSRVLRSKKHGPRRLPLRFALRVRLAALADASRCPWKAAVAAPTTEGGKAMNTLHTIDTDYELTWDEFVITVEDLHLIETGADLAEDDYATVLAAFERGLSPNGCVMSLIDTRRSVDQREHWFLAA